MWFDAGEFATVGAQFGIGHPPGQPLYTLLLGLFARAPGLDPLVGMNLLSALPTAACALPAAALLRRYTRLSPVARLLVLLTAGGLAPVWDQASRIELYGMSTLLALTLVAAGAAAVDEERLSLWRWLGLGLLAGALAGFNAIFAVAAALSLGVYTLPTLWRSGLKSFTRVTAGAVVGGVLGTALSYAYIGVVHSATDRIIWGEWDTTQGVMAFLTGADYAHTVHSAWALVPIHAAEWGVWLMGQGALPAILLGVAGWLVTPALRRRIVLCLPLAAMGVAFTFSYGTYYTEIPDYNGYLTPLMWLAASVGWGGLLSRLPSTPALVLAGGMTLFTLSVGVRPIWQRDRSEVIMPDHLARAWLEALPERSFTVVKSDHLVFPLLYLTEVEGLRPDVVLINYGFAASSWYWRHLFHRHPDLPQISLAAPNSAVRLRRLFNAASDRPVQVESLSIAAQLGAQPCPATWGAFVGPACQSSMPVADTFKTALRTYWQGGAAHDLISPKVIAGLARHQAEFSWLRGDATAALHALRLGLPPKISTDLPVPADLKIEPVRPLPPPQNVLIGDPDDLLTIGASILELLNQPESKAWADKMLQRGG